MSSDEKALKPSERIEQLYEALMYSTDKKLGSITGRQVAIIQYLDEQAELLDTHTVKEEKEVLLGEDKSDRVHVKLFGYRKDGHVYITREEVKEEPTTPEKKSWCERAFGVGNCPHRGWNRNDIY